MKIIGGRFTDYEYFEEARSGIGFQKNLETDECDLIIDSWVEIEISKEFYEAAKKEFCKEGDAK